MHRRHRRVPRRTRLPQPAERLHRVEARRTPRATPRPHARQHPGDQPVNVEQRHDVHAPIRRRQRQRLPNMPRRSANIPLAERHNLGPRSRPRCVQHQRRVVGPRRAQCARCARPVGRAAQLRLQCKTPRRTVAQRRKLDDRCPRRLRRRPRRRVLAPLHDHRPRLKIREVEAELVRAVARIQRRGRSRRGDPQKRRRHLRPVRQHNPNRIPATQPKPVQRRRRPLNLLPQSRKRQRLPTRRPQRRTRPLMRGEQLDNGGCGGRCSHGQPPVNPYAKPARALCQANSPVE